MAELEDKVKDLEQKVDNLFMDNVALKTKLEASREVERQQQEEIARLKEEIYQVKERLLQALRAQVTCTFRTLIVCISFKHIFFCTTGHDYSRSVTIKDQGVTAGGD